MYFQQKNPFFLRNSQGNFGRQYGYKRPKNDFHNRPNGFNGPQNRQFSRSYNSPNYQVQQQYKPPSYNNYNNNRNFGNNDRFQNRNGSQNNYYNNNAANSNQQSYGKNNLNMNNSSYNRNGNNNNKRYYNNSNNNPQPGCFHIKNTPEDNTLDTTSSVNIISYDAQSMAREGSINGKSCKVLFDTGSEITLISQELFQTLNLDNKIETPRCREIQAVNQATITLLGQIKVPLKFEDFEFDVTLQIIRDIGWDIVFGRDEMHSHVLNINYKDSLITFNPDSQLKECCNTQADNKITLKGFLTVDLTLAPYSEELGFLYTEAVTGQLHFEVKGLISLTSEKKIIIHDNSEVTRDPKGIPCLLSIFF